MKKDDMTALKSEAVAPLWPAAKPFSSMLVEPPHD